MGYVLAYLYISLSVSCQYIKLAENSDVPYKVIERLNSITREVIVRRAAPSLFLSQ